MEDIDGMEVYKDDVSDHAPTYPVMTRVFWNCFEGFIIKILLLIQRIAFSVNNFECLNYLADGKGFSPDLK